MENDPFPYEPLSLHALEIRLIQVSTRQNDSQLILCTMEHAILPKDFVALSYTWGQEIPLYTVYINGRAFPVRQNLYDFLATISQTGSYEDKWIWIDQICIDQKNEPERNRQVSQMGDIYSNANLVIAWLGRAVASSDYWLDLINQNCLPTMIEVQEILPFWSQLFSNPYWCRVWITQEVILPRKLTMLLGNNGVDIESLQPYLESCLVYMGAKEKPHTQLAIRRAMSLLQCRASRSEKGLDWPAAIALEEFAKCKETLDYVYGVNGLVAKEYAVEVDYGTAPARLFFLVLRASYKSFNTHRNRMALQTRSMSPDEGSLGMDFHFFARHLQRLLGLDHDQDVAAFLHWSIKEQGLLRDTKYAAHIEYMIRKFTIPSSMGTDEEMEHDCIVRTMRWCAYTDAMN